MKIDKIGLVTFFLGCFAYTAQATLIPVLEYSFPDSYAGGGPALTDQSAAGNNGFIDGAGTGGYLAADRPPSFATGGSLTGSTGGHGQTDATLLLNNTDVAANGGFTMDTWFRWDGNFTNTRKLIDYAGTEYLRTFNSEIQFVLSNAATVIGAPIVGGQWYHVRGEFDSGSNLPDLNGDLAGTASLYLDDVLISSVATTKTVFGDSLNRPIGINRWAGGGADFNQGAIYNPAVYLGLSTIPEPTSLALLLLGFGLLGRVRFLRPAKG